MLSLCRFIRDRRMYSSQDGSVSIYENDGSIGRLRILSGQAMPIHRLNQAKTGGGTEKDSEIMKVVFDTNVVLNAAMGRPGHEKAQELIQAVISGEISGIVTANSLTDIHFIVRKRAGEEKARIVIYNVLSLFDIAPVDGDVCLTALSTPMNDYEDAVLAVCAAKEDADYIATNDKGFISVKGSPVLALRPADVLNAIRAEGE